MIKNLIAMPELLLCGMGNEILYDKQQRIEMDLSITKQRPLVQWSVSVELKEVIFKRNKFTDL